MRIAGSTRTSCCKTERQRGLSTQLQAACSVDLLIPLRAPLPLAHRRQPVQTLQPATAVLPTRRVLLMGVGTRSSNSASAISTIGSTRLPETYTCSTLNARLKGVATLSHPCGSSTVTSIRTWGGPNTSVRPAQSKDAPISPVHTENATSTTPTDRSPRNRRTTND